MSSRPATKFVNPTRERWDSVDDRYESASADNNFIYSFTNLLIY